MADIDRVQSEAKVRRKILKQEIHEAEIRSKYKSNELKESAEEVDGQLHHALKNRQSFQAAYDFKWEDIATKSENAG